MKARRWSSSNQSSPSSERKNRSRLGRWCRSWRWRHCRCADSESGHSALLVQGKLSEMGEGVREGPYPMETRWVTGAGRGRSASSVAAAATAMVEVVIVVVVEMVVGVAGKLAWPFGWDWQAGGRSVAMSSGGEMGGEDYSPHGDFTRHQHRHCELW